MIQSNKNGKMESIFCACLLTEFTIHLVACPRKFSSEKEFMMWIPTFPNFSIYLHTASIDEMKYKYYFILLSSSSTHFICRLEARPADYESLK